MSSSIPARVLSPLRLRAIALLRLRRVVRTRLAAAAAVATLAPWLLVESGTLLGRLAALTAFTVVGLTVLGAGAPGDDLDGGQYAIAATHDATPVEVLAGECVATLAAAAILVAAQLPFAIPITGARLLPFALCLGWLAALLAGWTALMLLAGTLVQGKGNAVAMLPVLVGVPAVLHSALLDPLPAALAGAVRAVVELLPHPDRAAELYRAALYGTPASATAHIALLCSPVAYFALAAYRLTRLEPAARVTQ